MFKGRAFFCGEAKYRVEGRSFSVVGWINGKQGHQYRNLKKYSEAGGFCFLLVFRKIGKKIRNYVMPIDRIDPKMKYLPYDKMYHVDTFDELVDSFYSTG
jgi:penicillin-binding protein-related factor A (putative recombinase)